MSVKRLYVDMDGVLVDFASGIARLDAATRDAYDGHFDDAPGIFALMDPMPGALEAFTALAARFDAYILSTAPWDNPSAWSDKVAWVRTHPGEVARKRLILSHHKDLCAGDYLVDDRTAHGADRFGGEHIHPAGRCRWPSEGLQVALEKMAMFSPVAGLWLWFAAPAQACRMVESSVSS